MRIICSNQLVFSRTQSTVLTIVLLCSGCGSSIVSKNVISSAEIALENAKELYLKENFSEAKPILDTAIIGGGLNPDLYGEAILMRAHCHLEADNIDAAQSDLGKAEQGSPPADQLHLVRGLIFRKQGDQTKANQEFAKAKLINKKIVIKAK